jgi:hypothetical protein
LPKSTQVADNTTPSSEPPQVANIVADEEEGLGWRVFLLPLIAFQGVGIGWVLWRLGSHRKRL